MMIDHTDKIQMLKKILIVGSLIVAIWFSLSVKGCANSSALVIFDRVYSFTVNYSVQKIQKPAPKYKPIESDTFSDKLTDNRENK